MSKKLVNSLEFARKFTQVEDARVVADPGEITWNEESDFVVVGYGGAGVAAANQAADGGLEVIALDRCDGGGATKMNGGIMYFGGGTWVQKESGYDDTPEEMFIYLKRELRDAVTDETLRAFCESGPETIKWLEKHGVEFKASAYPTKTSYPSEGYYLYHPDNSLLKRFRTNRRPSPRGHKAVSEAKDAIGSGIGIFRPQEESAARAGVRVYGQCQVRQMIVDTKGAVVGLKARRVPVGTAAHAALVKAQQSMNKWLFVYPNSYPGGKIPYGIAKYYERKASRIEAEHGEDFFVRARKGVCLSSGGFIFNTEMLRHYAPTCADVATLGTPADDGSGILLGHSAGGVMTEMDEVSIWRHMSPPKSWPKNMIVNARGNRFVDEASYGADIGREMMKPESGGRAWLILDANMWKQANLDLKDKKLVTFQKLPPKASMLFGSKKAPTLEALCKKVGINHAGLLTTLETYRRAAAGEIADPFEKDSGDMVVPKDGPFYAVDVGVNTPLNPAYAITVGGLLVDEKSGLVMREDGTTIPGLYSAGRTAVGLCTRLYLSGLSASDCIFSGRRAGRHAADATIDHSPIHQGVSAVWPQEELVG
ncbi:FAD-binding protein [Sphingomonas oligophenolica]|uniref:FAD-binding protein n=1 Tax=Sphingomonas oligophenolica TaxID=301154 RepID=A0ABU9YA35_9SPHN